MVMKYQKLKLNYLGCYFLDHYLLRHNRFRYETNDKI